MVPLKDSPLFYKRRISRVLVPYFVWSVIFGIVSILKQEFNTATFLGQIISFRTCGIYYYFAVYIQLVLLTPLLGGLLHSKYWKLGFWITPVFYIPVYVFAVMRNPIKFPWNAICCVMWLVFYYFGLCVRNGRLKLKPENAGKWFIALIVVNVIQAIEGSGWFLFGDFDMATGNFKYTSLVGSVISIALFILYIENGSRLLFHVKRNRLTAVILKSLKMVGDNSFGIYLSHILVMSALNKVLYTRINNIFPLNALILLIVEMIGIEIFKKVFGRWPRFCKWVGLV